MKAVISSLIVLTLAAAAQAAEFHPSTYTTYIQHDPYSGRVGVLNALPSNERSYTEIGIVRVTTNSVSDYNSALSQLKREAAQHGGTAIVLQDDAILFSQGGVTDSGSAPKYASAIAIIRN